MIPRRRPKTGTSPGMKGRFDGYDVLAEARTWDAETRDVVLSRIVEADEAGPEEATELAFFAPEEAEAARALLDQLLAQFEEPKVPLLELVDRRLAAGETDGWRYESLPEDSDAWRQSLAYLDEDAKERFGHRFHECTRQDQASLIQEIQDAETFHGWNAGHLWSLWTRYACSAFYAHPWAWNEIGFGGPAYPRGYKVLHEGWREPWERREAEPIDPVPWAQRAEDARRRHEQVAPPRRGRPAS